jgi:uncharacterized OB-fold protein
VNLSNIIKDKKTGDPILHDLRELRLKYELPVGRVSRFFQGLEEGKILATRCRKCGARYFPPQSWCSECGSQEVEWFEPDPHGYLSTFTVINVKPKSFNTFKDYVVGIAELPKDELKVLAWVMEEPSKIRVGAKVRVGVVKREDGLSYGIFPED